MEKIIFLLLIIVFSITSKSQTLDWIKTVGGICEDVGNSIAINEEGDVFTIGYFCETVDFDPNNNMTNLTSDGFFDIFIQKLDSEGNLIFVKSMGGISDQKGNSIAVDKSNNIYSTGVYTGTSNFDPNDGISYLMGSENIYIQKLDESGNLIWAKGAGGLSHDTGMSITVDNVGNVYSTGFFSITAAFDFNDDTYNLTSSGSRDIFIQKLDSNGNLIWVRGMGGPNSDIGNSIAVDNLGNVYSTGYFSSISDFDPNEENSNFLISNGSWDIFIQKLDSEGNLVWAKGIGGTSDDVGNSIAIDNYGNIYTTGRFSGAVDFDPNDGTYYLEGEGEDIFIQKLDLEGNLIWAKRVGGSNNDIGYSITTDDENNIYITGHFSGAVDFDPNDGTYYLEGEGEDIFIQKLDSEGNLIWAKRVGGTGTGDGLSIKVDEMKNIYITGYFSGTIDFDPDENIFNSISAEGGPNDIFILKLTGELNVGLNYIQQSKVKLYPNPNSGQFNIEISEEVENARFEVVNNLGKKVYKGFLNKTASTINLPGLSSGIYHITIILDTGRKFYTKCILVD
ncbi:MAG: SBBP repeat-containing protein [Saprospiraceae bacterium]|nr:SBBP repeat-containing protein [Saprospiraceae bacterium]MCB9324967.1 SBBP repeat-containing protein [Lewinellaceae bacterium]